MRPILWLMLFLGAAGGVYSLGSHLAKREAPLHADDPRLLTGDAKIVMLAADWCGYCRKLQAEFEREGVRYRVLDVDEEEGDRAANALGTRGVPVTATRTGVFMSVILCKECWVFRIRKRRNRAVSDAT